MNCKLNFQNFDKLSWIVIEVVFPESFMDIFNFWTDIDGDGITLSGDRIEDEVGEGVLGFVVDILALFEKQDGEEVVTMRVFFVIEGYSFVVVFFDVVLQSQFFYIDKFGVCFIEVVFVLTID